MNHRAESGIWLIFEKKGSIPYRHWLTDTVEEAICYGWIDSRVKRFGESKLGVCFTPRRSPDNWSKYNKARALKLLREGKITDAGLAVLPPEWRKSEKLQGLTRPKPRER